MQQQHTSAQSRQVACKQKPAEVAKPLVVLRAASGNMLSGQWQPRGTPTRPSFLLESYPGSPCINLTQSAYITAKYNKEESPVKA